MIQGSFPNAHTSLFQPKETKLTQIAGDIEKIYGSNCSKCKKHDPSINKINCTDSTCSTYAEIANLRKRLCKK